MKTLKIFIFFSLFFFSHLLFSQDPPCGTPCNPKPGVEQAPIDGGVIGLLVAGISYGFYKFKKQVA